MKSYHIILFSLVFLAVGTSPARSVPAVEGPVTALLRALNQFPVVILGEKHHRQESTQLVADVVSAYQGSSGVCLMVALEIISDQQSAIDAAMAGTGKISHIHVHPIIDHPGFRALLAQLRQITASGKCLHVSAIDAPRSSGVSRDEWMADQVQRLAARGPVLVLVGNLHALKRVEWEDDEDRPYLAERLERRGLRLTSALQQWGGDCAPRNGQWFPAGYRQTIDAIHTTLSPAAARLPSDPLSLVDGVVDWTC